MLPARLGLMGSDRLGALCLLVDFVCPSQLGLVFLVGFGPALVGLVSPHYHGLVGLARSEQLGCVSLVGWWSQSALSGGSNWSCLAWSGVLVGPHQLGLVCLDGPVQLDLLGLFGLDKPQHKQCTTIQM